MKKQQKKPAVPSKSKATEPQQELTNLGVIVNLMLQIDHDAQLRVIRYLDDRFGG